MSVGQELNQQLKPTITMGRRSKSSDPMQDTNLSDLNTRDILLLSQLSEEHGIENYSKIHQELVNNPAFKLSHNRLNDTELELSEDQVEHLVNELIALHSDKKIVAICEHYYQLRVQELMAEISATKTEFDKVKEQ